jgi:single-strand DNA-binding protein
VVPRFRGELTLLGSGSGREGGGGTEIGSAEDFDGATGYRSPAPGSGPTERDRPASIADQLDDDIPF